MHRYPTRFATMNRSYFPADDEEYVPESSAHDDADSYDSYVASQRVVTHDGDDPRDDDYVVNLNGWNVRNGRRPVTRSMTRSATLLNARVATLRSSRR
jgi:hypothetical protein